MRPSSARPFSSALLLLAGLLGAVPAAAQRDDSASVAALKPSDQGIDFSTCHSLAQNASHVDTRDGGTHDGNGGRVFMTSDGSIVSREFARVLIKINLAPPCTEAEIVVEFDGTPTGWALHLGDSWINEGTGRRSRWGTPNATEVILRGQTLTVYDAAGVRMFDRTLALEDGALKFVVRNGYLSFGPDHTELSGNLFTIPDPAAGKGDGGWIYLGLNRVIDSRVSRGGLGVRRVSVNLH